jgi:hypothetical protein
MLCGCGWVTLAALDKWDAKEGDARKSPRLNRAAIIDRKNVNEVGGFAQSHTHLIARTISKLHCPTDLSSVFVNHPLAPADGQSGQSLGSSLGCDATAPHY